MPDQSKIKILLQVTANQQIEIKRMATILLVYSQSDNMTSDMAKMAMKMGADGGDVLKTMMQNKMKGQ